MKRIVLLIAAVAFSASLAAQDVSSMETEEATDVAVETVAEQTAVTNEQIVEAISKDEALQEETINHLKAHPDAMETMASLDEDHAGSKQDIINAVLNNPDLTAAAVEFVKSNPELLNKVVKLVM